MKQLLCVRRTLVYIPREGEGNREGKEAYTSYLADWSRLILAYSKLQRIVTTIYLVLLASKAHFKESLAPFVAPSAPVLSKIYSVRKL